ncbi:MAG: permease [Bacteroidales bacterium]|nr:permease [Bacteroidales bacterium]
MELILLYWKSLVELTTEMAPYLLFGFLFAGLLRVFFPKRLLLKYMGKSNLSSAVNASLLGVPMPLCSCGVLPTGLSLRQNGASRGATNSFLISTPQTGVDSILVTYSMLGLPFAIIRPIVALLTGITGGLLTNTLVKEKAEPAITPKGIDEQIPKTLKFMLHYAYVEFLQDISKWLVIGLLIAAGIAVILPDDFFTAYVNSDFTGMLIILAASVPLYVCATASVPIAAVLLLKGLSPGAILVFLMAGPATNTATFTVLFKTMGRKSTWIYLSTIILGALFFGLLINLLPREWFVLPHQHHALHDHHEFLPHWLGVASAITLVLLIINGFIRKYYPKKTITSMEPTSFNFEKDIITIKVGGMTCNHCKNNVETNIRALSNIEEASADLQSQTVRIKGADIDEPNIKKTVEGLGYTYGGRV